MKVFPKYNMIDNHNISISICKERKKGTEKISLIIQTKS